MIGGFCFPRLFPIGSLWRTVFFHRALRRAFPFLLFSIHPVQGDCSDFTIEINGQCQHVCGKETHGVHGVRFLFSFYIFMRQHAGTIQANF
ncbi:hypothetical protein C8Q69DRAFT_137932 [Paecilomyces variotii]|uniref:Uncharacterized protein n=1 Tax=Byssochlamys spectabilis TaxID=264951 RepID=A0A443I093_BYSSP|nr:hypothetical protein C8Q69DRAFT_137932 [Paecilomyces variotii]RWQ97483.1 hypothetical protein C8Q69DRAFT_137932 [Paecilomyces variotii]